LEKYVTKFFANIPSNWLPPDDFTKFKNNIPFNTSAFQKVYKVRPVKDISQVCDLNTQIQKELFLYILNKFTKQKLSFTVTYNMGYAFTTAFVQK